MSYSGATAASSVSNPPRLLVGRFQGVPNTTALSTANPGQNSQGGNLWFYSSTNKTTDITATNFFSDGWKLGMRAGDMVQGNWFTSNGSTVITFLGSISAASTGGCTLGSGSLITSS